MTSSTQTLPDGFIQTDEINLAKNKSLAITLNFMGFIISILCYIFLVLFTGWARRESFIAAFTINASMSSIYFLLPLIVFIAISLIMHELIHGFFFWFFTRSKPVYALHLAYAYAAAPAWYIPVKQYLIIGLSPLVLIDAFCLVLILLMPAAWLLIPVILAAFNTGGSIGDLWIMICLAHASPACLVNDVGDGVTFFEPLKLKDP